MTTKKNYDYAVVYTIIRKGDGHIEVENATNLVIADDKLMATLKTVSGIREECPEDYYRVIIHDVIKLDFDIGSMEVE